VINITNLADAGLNSLRLVINSANLLGDANTTTG
jgi:hypothetical protein